MGHELATYVSADPAMLFEAATVLGLALAVWYLFP